LKEASPLDGAQQSQAYGLVKLVKDDKEGNYLLEFDYNQDPELIMDILKYGSGVKVLAPASLRKRVKDELTKALINY